MGVEVVLLVPVVMLIGLLIVAMGRYVSAEGAVQAAAREAVRAATLERSGSDAITAAQGAATTSLTSALYLNCGPAALEGAFVPGNTVTVRLDCQVSWSQLGAIGLPGTVAVTASSSAPLDLNRRAAP